MMTVKMKSNEGFAEREAGLDFDNLGHVVSNLGKFISSKYFLLRLVM
jgi:hypothetical protein